MATAMLQRRPPTVPHGTVGASAAPYQHQQTMGLGSVSDKIHVMSAESGAHNALDKRQWGYLQGLHDEAHKGFISAHIHSNNQFVDGTTAPRGNVLVFAKDAEMNPKAVSERLGAIKIYVPIEDSDRYTEAYFKSRLPLLKGQGVLPKSDPKGLDMDLLESSGVTGIDVRPWRATLGRRGNSVTVVKRSVGRNQYEYLIRVQSDSQALGFGLRRLLVELIRAARAKGKVYTFGDFLQSPEYNTTVLLAKRNAQRLAVEAANVLGVSVPSSNDPYAHVLPHRAVPQLATPSVVNVFSSLKGSEIRRVPVVLVYNHAVDSAAAKGGVLLSTDPTYPERLYTKYSKEIGADVEQFENTRYGSFPAFMGKRHCATTGEKLLSEPMTEQVKSMIHGMVTWDGKDDSERNITHPMLLHQYNLLDDAHHQWNQQRLGARYPYEDFETVICKIAPPEAQAA